MNIPLPSQPSRPAAVSQVDEEQLRRWLRLRRELTELHAQLEYLKLMVTLGVS